MGTIAQQPDLPAAVVAHGRLSYETGAAALAVIMALVPVAVVGQPGQVNVADRQVNVTY